MEGTQAEGEESSHSPPGDKIHFYIEKLNSLKEGEGAVAELIACGRSAIEPLRQYLLEGKPSVVYHSRCWAVEALGGLGAKETLLEYLQQKKNIADAAIRMGEEAVESAAARELIRWPGEEVFRVLLGIAQERCLPGVLEILAEFKKSEAIPFLVKGLEDDIGRRSAEEALRKIGSPAEPDLIRAAVSALPNQAAEAPSSLLRRRSAVRLLAEMGVSEDKWSLLRPLLKETDGEILVSAFRIAVRAAAKEDRALAGQRVIQALGNADWFLTGKIERALFEHFGEVESVVEEEIVRRQPLTEGKRILDPILTTLWKVKRRAKRAVSMHSERG